MNLGHHFRVNFAFLLFLLVGIGSLFVCPISLSAAQKEVTTEVKHKSIKHFVSGNRIALDAKVSDEAGIKLVRCYFKADEQAEYVFVPMVEINGQKYQAILPAPADYAEQIQYLFLVVNLDQQVVKTQPFMVKKTVEEKEAPAWQEVEDKEELSIYTELSKPPEEIAGFSDSLTIDAVESSLRFGMVAGGIYSASATASAGSTTGAAAAATSAGSISATTGISTTVVVLATAAGVAAAAGTVAAVDDDDHHHHHHEAVNINPNASVSWGDANSPPKDWFKAIFGSKQRDLGTASSMKTETGLEIGLSDLIITAVSVSSEMGDLVVTLGGGAYFQNDGSTHKETSLEEGQNIVYQVFVPEPDEGSAKIEW